MIGELIKSITNNNIPLKEGYYIVNYISGECHCFHYIWNGPLRNICKHVHAAKLYKESMEQVYIDIVYTNIKIIEIFF